MTTYTEVRVQADHADPKWKADVPPYDFTFSEWRSWAGRKEGETTQEAARGFLSLRGVERGLTNVRVTRRTVTVTEWTPVELKDTP